MSTKALPRTTVEFLDALREKLGGVSDYRASIALGVTRAAVSGWRQGKTKIGEEQVPKIAELLELRPEYVLACVAAERAKRTDVREIWESLAKHARKLSVLGVVAFATSTVTPPHAHASEVAAQDLYILSNLRRRLLAALSGVRARAVGRDRRTNVVPFRQERRIRERRQNGRPSQIAARAA